MQQEEAALQRIELVLFAVSQRTSAVRAGVFHGTGLPEVVGGELAIRARHRFGVAQDGDRISSGRPDRRGLIPDPDRPALVAHHGFVARRGGGAGGLTGRQHGDEAEAADKDQETCFQIH